MPEEQEEAAYERRWSSPHVSIEQTHHQEEEEAIMLVDRKGGGLLLLLLVHVPQHEESKDLLSDAAATVSSP